MSRGFLVWLALVLGAGAALAVMVAETRPSSSVPAWMVGTFHTLTPYPSVIRILPSGEAHNLILQPDRGTAIGRGLAVETPQGGLVDFRYSGQVTLEVTLAPRAHGFAVVKSDPDACGSEGCEAKVAAGAHMVPPWNGEFAPVPFAPGALCWGDDGEIEREDPARPGRCDWTVAARQMAEVCCEDAHRLVGVRCRAQGVEARLEECRRIAWAP